MLDFIGIALAFMVYVNNSVLYIYIYITIISQKRLKISSSAFVANLIFSLYSNLQSLYFKLAYHFL